MINTITVIGELNLWNNAHLEISDVHLDSKRKSIIITFLRSENDDRHYSTDKLEIKGIRDFQNTTLIFAGIQSLGQYS